MSSFAPVSRLPHYPGVQKPGRTSFGNLSKQVKESGIPGAILSSSYEHLAKAKKEACLLYNDILSFLDKLIIKYMHNPHRELDGKTPQGAWNEFVDQYGPPKIPKLTPEMRHHFWRLDPHQRTISPKGICAFGMHYWSADLMTIPRFAINGKMTKYSIRYDPTELNRIALFVEHGTEDYVSLLEAKELRRPDGSLNSLSMAERELALYSAKAKGKSASSWLEELDIPSKDDEFDDTIKERLEQKRRARRQQSTARQPSKADIRKAEQRIHDDPEGSEYTEYDDYIRSWGRK